ncbi:glucose-1-phosphate cytidylyltransferase [Rhodopseudomonas thermotolerans]|uniref:Glucose-1-phosphate cytidylyltransferase n=2 Tax=Rhodopseudomonas TaxID=1073 RepID=A0A336JVH7_9BRAD|nr:MULTISPECIES: glucose-1-phosphate cytidylyltransferase [Rhodopseudomonas]RED37976.1 glucose-1-phosphate cytidylyltransferase [Rhodopseudomonas pentothenatexigens]REG05169.1 glucose-1-phosphate cytidylyltransferase [Rhodopseudomonas thermotolerans]SSW90001.1 glucose-1-phosphate cytidylyltransferase [Rhodopseudomonas pentothenatexigens]
MQVVILAGGKGTRIAEETSARPKPMVEIGNRPIIWHIMKYYSCFGLNDFIVCLGYKGYMFKEYFANYFLHMSDVTLDIANNKIEVHQVHAEPWRVTFIDTGEETQTGGRLKRVRSHIRGDAFCFTYGDGLSNVDVNALIAFHKAEGCLATVTAVQPPGRFGVLDMESDRIIGFQEKPAGEGGWVNGGYFVLSPKVIDYIEDDATIWEREPMERLARERNLSAFVHRDFWQPMDTLRDKINLERMWETKAPWKIW